MPHVFLDPDGTNPIGLAVVVSHPTDVVYANPCGGLATEERSAEGYLVLCPSHPSDAPDDDLAEALRTFFARNFRGGTRRPWTTDLGDQLAAIVRRIPFWYEDSQDSKLSHLDLDRSRLDECIEAWVPVLPPIGPGILVSDDSD